MVAWMKMHAILSQMPRKTLGANTPRKSGSIAKEIASMTVMATAYAMNQK